ncbi:MAG: alkaline phosphatase family protein [Gemmatimonadales bacterium]
MRRIVSRLPALLLVLTVARAAALSAQSAPPSPPVSLVVVIVVDQMRGDYVDRFAVQLTGGLARLTREGAVFAQGYQDHGMAETAPGHATVGSGRNPASTGIVRNSEGVPDSSSPLLEVIGPGASPRRFRGTTLFDWMQARWPESRALSVSRKDRGAILPVGHSRQQVFWYQSGQFTTSRYYMDALPDWVQRFNQMAVGARTPGRVWDLLLPASSYSEPDSADYENRGRDFTFPHRLPMDSAAAATAFINTPFIDSLTLALALEGVSRTGVGNSADHPDLLVISLSATDYVGHAYGPDSREQHDNILRLDRQLGMFLDSLAKLRDMRRVVLALTADHGVTSYPEYSNAHGDQHAQWVSPFGFVRGYRADLERVAGPGAWIRFFELGLLVMDRAGLAARGVNVDSVVGRMAGELRRLAPVREVDTRQDLMARDTATDWIARRWLNTVPPDLPVELMVTLKPRMSWGIPGSSAEHGQPTDDDTHVEYLLWGNAVRPGRYTSRVSVVDIAPTLAHVLGINPLEPVQGRVLREALR